MALNMKWPPWHSPKMSGMVDSKGHDALAAAAKRLGRPLTDQEIAEALGNKLPENLPQQPKHREPQFI